MHLDDYLDVITLLAARQRTFDPTKWVDEFREQAAAESLKGLY